tara:strand:+ start:12436 stop:13713 length:1278 start_codon:yes stop_codon:yes gene_type:complete
MSAVVGDQVTPGSTVTIPPGSSAGEGIFERNGRCVATLPGILVEKAGNISIESSRLPINSPKVDDVVIGQVTRLNENVAEIRILHIESKQGGHRDLPALELFADIHVSEVVDRFIPSPGDAMRMRDIVRARIVKDDPILKASTKGHASLGVLSASCPTCGVILDVSDKKIDFNVDCSRCDYTAYRVLSDGFGHGHETGFGLNKLNRSGERWSPEAEAKLGHDGARPYLSPMADFRRGANHEMPARVASMRSSSRGGGRGGQSRPRREMHDTVCTMCGVSTKVPFKPTPGKPIRCRDCMDKVKQGKATKEELSKERERISAMREELEDKMGVKLFVGRLPFEISEEELSRAFSEHGKIDSIHIAKDRESGKSKGFAFVTFPSKEEAKAAIKAMNGSEIKGRRIVVEESSSGGSSRNRGGRRKQSKR